MPQDTTPDVALYEANCPEFVVGGHAGRVRRLPAAGRAVLRRGRDRDPVVHQPAGRPHRHRLRPRDRPRRRLDLVDRARRSRPRHDLGGHLGRPHLRHAQRRCVAIRRRHAWHRIDSSTAGGSPTRFPSGIYVDPADTGHAWITYSGYNAVTPTTPGHVFDVHENGIAPGSGTFTNLNVESGTSAFPTPHSDGDLPVSDVVRDDSSETLYVVDRLRRPPRRRRRHRRLARDGGHAALRGHAPRDPAVLACRHVRARQEVQAASSTRRRTRRASGG